jgi:hypothetical protein
LSALFAPIFFPNLQALKMDIAYNKDELMICKYAQYSKEGVAEIKNEVLA